MAQNSGYSQLACQHCGQPFVRTRKGGKPQVHCSDRCRRAFATKAMNVRRAAERPSRCIECGGQIVQPERGRPRVFCSNECKARTHNRRGNRRRLPLRDTAPEPRRCAFCNEEFVPRRRDQIYCPDRWCGQYAYAARKKAGEPLRQVEQVKTCHECGAEFTAFNSNARWCSQTCRNRHTGRVRSRRRGPVQSEPYTDREIFERDNWTCHLCGGSIDPELSRTDWMGATIDHVVPIAAGGSDTRDNVAAAHWKCNHEKRERALGQVRSRQLPMSAADTTSYGA